jgi:CheY-like chemotaxis protein
MRPRVLVVDDKDTIVSLLRTVLQGTCDVTSSPDGRQALSLALAGDFDVVVTDARMPGLDGSSLLQELRSAKPDVEVVLMPAFPSLEKTVEAMRAGETREELGRFERLSYAEAMGMRIIARRKPKDGLRCACHAPPSRAYTPNARSIRARKEHMIHDTRAVSRPLAFLAAVSFALAACGGSQSPAESPEVSPPPGDGTSGAPSDGKHTMPDGTEMEGEHPGEHTMPDGTKMKGHEHGSGESK